MTTRQNSPCACSHSGSGPDTSATAASQAPHACACNQQEHPSTVNTSCCHSEQSDQPGKTCCNGAEQAHKPSDSASQFGYDWSTGHCNCSMPQVTFSTFVLSLASSALVQLGEVPDPDSGTLHQDLVMAQHSIDILTMLQGKTAPCLDADESRLLEGLIYELRMKYVMNKG